ncbi:MAG TPA: CoA-binding protein [Erysipelothrix sp.]
MNAYDILKNNERYAVVGMHEDESKYAHKIYKLLKEKGKSVYGLNPKFTEINGDRIYADLNELNKEVDVAVFVVNPKIGIHMLDDMKKYNVSYLWMQPGSLDEDFRKKAESMDLKIIEACVLAVYAIHDR